MMWRCLFHVRGADLDADAFLNASPFVPYQVWHRGTPAGEGLVYAESGFSVEVRGDDGGTATLSEAIFEFLRGHGPELMRLRDGEAATRRCLEVWVRADEGANGGGCEVDGLALQLVAVARLSLEVRFFPGLDDGPAVEGMGAPSAWNEAQTEPAERHAVRFLRRPLRRARGAVATVAQLRQRQPAEALSGGEGCARVRLRAFGPLFDHLHEEKVVFLGQRLWLVRLEEIAISRQGLRARAVPVIYLPETSHPATVEHQEPWYFGARWDDVQLAGPYLRNRQHSWSLWLEPERVREVERLAAAGEFEMVRLLTVLDPHRA